MEGERSFIAEFHEVHLPREYEEKEIRQDAPAWPKDAANIAELKFSGFTLSPDQEDAYRAARDEWWINKYGFPYEERSAREEVLRRKYAAPEELSRVAELQKQMLEAYGAGNKKRLKELKEVYEQDYPGELEGITALFELDGFLDADAQLERDRKFLGDRWTQGRKDRAIAVTEYQFLLTHFVEINGEDKDFLGTFWNVLEEAARRKNRLAEAHRLRRAVLSQVAVYKILDSLQMNPRIAHPSLDAFDAIDILAGENTALQVKGASLKNTPHGEMEILESENISFPGVQSGGAGSSAHFNTFLSQNLQKFGFKLGKYAERTGKKMKGYLVEVPYEKTDFVTGAPDPELIEKARKTLPAKTGSAS